MILKKLEKTDLQNNKRIICHTMVKDYLRQMEAEFGVLDRIDYIADDLKNNYGVCKLDEAFSFDVVGNERLLSENWNTHILVITSECYWLKFEALSDLLDGKLNTIYYFEDIDTRYYREYLDQYQEAPLQDMIVFRSGMRDIKAFQNGDFSDNAKALFDFALANDMNEKYRLIWIVGYPERYDDYKNVKNVSFIGDDWSHSEKKAERDLYYEAICLGKYFFFTEHSSFIRLPREGQIRVQLWHGNGYKARSFYISMKHECEYAIVTSEATAKTHKAEFEYTDQQIRITGLPKQDWIFHPKEIDFLYEMGLKRDKKMVLWLPTFRSTGQALIVDRDTLHSETGLPILNTVEKLNQINQFLIERDMLLVIKPHPEQKKVDQEYEFENIFFIDNDVLTNHRLHVNQIAGHMAAFISDYSSATTDCSLLDRPMAFALEDLEEYEEKRGFVFDHILDWLPGELLYTVEDMERFLDEVYKGEDPTAEKRRDVRSRMVKYGDDRNCERVLEMVGISC